MVNERPVCGAGIVCLRAGAVLLIRRARPPLQGQWSLPGGKIGWGETAQAAALRELKEETGVDAEIVGLIDVVDAIFPRAGAAQEGVASHHLLVDFAARWTAGEPRAGDDASAAAFLPLPEAIAAVEWSETRRIIAAGAALVEALGG